MTPISDPVLQAAARYAPDATQAAADTLASPWTIAVVGRVGAGKTTWINGRTGGSRPVGLGGVTQAVEAIEVGDQLWLDTPGIDGLDAAIHTLGGPIASSDAVLWVIDGLQPATRTERELLAATCYPGHARAAIIARLDLVEPDQHDGVRERVRQVLDAIEPPAGGDLRKLDLHLPSALAPAPTSPRRDLARQRAIREALGALEALPPLEGRAELGRRLADAWRSRVRSAVDEVTTQLVEGASDHPTAAPRALATASVEVRDGFLSDLRDEPALAQAVARSLPESAT